MLRSLVAGLLLAGSGASLGGAASLSIAPIRIDVVAPGNSAALKLTNADQRPVNVEVRLLKWSLLNGEDDYRESGDVAATPPVASIAPNASATIRIIRTGSRPVNGEESYRLVVDEIPDANRVRNIGVNLAIRYTIPVFFLDAEASQPHLQWSIDRRDGERILTAKNSGDKHVRVSAMKIGAHVLFKGLAGYVLGQSTKTWVLPPSAEGARVTAESDGAPINAALAR